MRRASSSSRWAAAWLLTGGLGAGCGAVDGPPAEIAFPPEPLTTMTTASGAWQVAVRTSPQPPIKGVDAVQLQITDAIGAGVDGLVLSAVPWMVAHGHGTSARTRVIPQGLGVYQIENVYLYMDGRWELRTSLASADVTDAVTPVFDVP
ncbi:MAG TPA: FixH family protein [Polyangia bacterium]|nr:FixH family protein [Polyangia bacterium]